MSRRFVRGRAAIAAALVVLAVCAVAITAASRAGSRADDTVATTKQGPPTYDRTTVQRRTLTETSDATGTIEFGDVRSLNAVGDGVVTAAAAEGSIVGPGEVVARVAQRPIVLVSGATPMYRELRRVRASERDVAGDRLGPMTGTDVEQLQRYLIGLGLDEAGKVADEAGTFGAATESAVEAWQRFVGHPATGRIDSSQIVFVDGAVRVVTAPAVGAPFADLTISDVEPVVSATITNQQRAFFAVGNTVAIEFIDRTVGGVVTDVERSQGSDGSAQYSVVVTPDAGANLDGLEVDDVAKVSAERVIADDVLSVPVRALIALAERGWAVQVESVDGPVLTAVELGEVVDGLAEIDGIPEGATVLVVAQ